MKSNSVSSLMVLLVVLCILWIPSARAAPIGEHPDHAGCIRITIIKRPLSTTPTTTTTTTTTTTSTTTTTRATTVPTTVATG
ncbi:hypothetical protein KR009_002245 [Drosophila setifemur]|nr:hypothetical protein KR009_002245 [Drosophila setifemur]